MKRVIYNRLTNGTQLSKPMLAKTMVVTVTLNELNTQFTIINTDTQEILLEGKAKNRQELLKNVKYSLKSLGVFFEDEVRNTVSL